MLRFFILIPSLLLILCCGPSFLSKPAEINETLVNADGKTLESRIAVPFGYERVTGDSSSFTFFLRNQSMKPDSVKVMLYNGVPKIYDVHAAVFDIDCGKKDLQQCADACIRLRAEYLWKTKQFDKIHFNLTNGFRMDYTKWRDGNRLLVNGNNTAWTKSADASSAYPTFRNYLDKVFMYAGTLSVEKELKPVTLSNLQPGDVFVIGGSPGHASMVADIATNDQGEKIFLLAQGYMPAQDIHIIKNPNDAALTPWFKLREGEALETMEWTFQSYTLGRFE